MFVEIYHLPKLVRSHGVSKDAAHDILKLENTHWEIQVLESGRMRPIALSGMKRIYPYGSTQSTLSAL